MSWHEQYMQLAIEKARQGIKQGQTPFGACLVKGHTVIACTHNMVWKITDITAHAEIQAIRKACLKLKTIDLSDLILYSTCEPCPMCFSACHWARIPKIVYGAAIKDAKKYGFNELPLSNKRLKQMANMQLEIIGGVMREENLELFELWSKQKYPRVY
jgi:tRNA(Arg) A34 adenosine deaminase TadA